MGVIIGWVIDGTVIKKLVIIVPFWAWSYWEAVLSCQNYIFIQVFETDCKIFEDKFECDQEKAEPLFRFQCLVATSVFNSNESCILILSHPHKIDKKCSWGCLIAVIHITLEFPRSECRGLLLHNICWST